MKIDSKTHLASGELLSKVALVANGLEFPSIAPC